MGKFGKCLGWLACADVVYRLLVRAVVRKAIGWKA